MELIVIDENKLKIMLSAPDMRHYDLRAERMSQADAETRRAFRHIFDDAREQIGFETEGERLFVQLYTSRGGGCEIFVTKLGSESEEDTALRVDAPREEDKDDPTPAHHPEDALLERIHRADAVPQVRTQSAVPRFPLAFRFGSLSDLLAACRRLCAVDYRGPSSAHHVVRDGADVWYLTLSAPTPRPMQWAFLVEYATEMNDPAMLGLYLSEYGETVIAEGAVETLGQI